MSTFHGSVHNYSGLYIGTAAASNRNPTQYWLMKPKNGAGLYKSVFTNAKNVGAPWSTEVGITPTNASQGVAGVATDSAWRMYTTVITPSSITAYYDGKLVGTYPLTKTIASFGSNLVAYIGKSPYKDPLMKGQVQNLRVYTCAMTAEQVLEECYRSASTATKNAWLKSIADALTVDDVVISNIVLPSSNLHNCNIVWSSSNPQFITADVTVTRPTKGSPDAIVTLTATITVGDAQMQKTFSVKVLENSVQKTLDYYADIFPFQYHVVTKNLILKDTFEDTTVTWASDNAAISSGGVVTRPASGDGDTKVTLTATFQYHGATTTHRYPVTVLEAPFATLLTYIKTGGTVRTDALHYAVSTDGTIYTALFNNNLILYVSGLTNHMGSPSVFRKTDGTFGLIATDNKGSNAVYLYDSADLMTFTGERKVPMTPSGVVKNAQCTYDGSKGVYRIVYSDGSSNQFVETSNFITFTAPSAYANALDTVSGTLPSGATQANAFALTKSEYTALVTKFARVHNTSVSVEDITVKRGADVTLPDSITASYSDGSHKNFGVTWDATDVASIDTSKAGTYSVSGTINQPDYGDVLVPERADPWVFQGDDGYYYFTGSYPIEGTAAKNKSEGYDRITLRRGKTLIGLKDAEEITIWNQKNSSIANRYIWAPEIHQINGTWYVFFTASVDGSVWSVRPHVLQCMGDDPTNPDNWQPAGDSNLHRMLPLSGDAFTHFSLDMTYFEANGTHYVIWAEKPGPSNLYIATIDPAAPWQLTSNTVLISTPDYAWEESGGNIINEDPAVIVRDGNVMLFFSAAATDYTYCVGVVTADEDANLLDIQSWTKTAYPLLTTDDLVNQYGPGHNSFTFDENGNLVIVYHARPYECNSSEGSGDCGYITGGSDPLSDPCRHARIKNVHFGTDGAAILNMTAEEELAPENKTVSITVTVKRNATPPPSINQTPGDTTTPGDVHTDKTPDATPDQDKTSAPTQNFADVSSNAWYTDAVQHVISTGAMKGVSDTQFAPELQLTRGMLAQILYNLDGNQAIADITQFTDVSNTAWYYNAVNWSAASNLVKGYGNGSFGADDTITREQFVVILHRYAQMKGYNTDAADALTAFADTDSVSTWALQAMQWAVGSHLVNGTTLTTLAPQEPVTRAQCAKLFMEFDAQFATQAD